jgi:hypothetical protein
MSIFARFFNKASTVRVDPKPIPSGLFVALDWSGKKRVFYGCLCATCGSKFQTDLRENLKLGDVFSFSHCGQHHSITIRELDALNLPSLRAEPSHASGARHYGNTTIIPTGTIANAGGSTDTFNEYQQSDPWKG